MLAAPAAQDEDFLEEVKKQIGDLSGIEIFHNFVLVAVYKRPEKTKSGLYMPTKTRDEDELQAHIGVIVKKGPQALQSNGEWVFDSTMGEGSWVIFRPSDGWGVKIKGVMCRMLVDTSIKGRITSPEMIW